MNKRCSSFRLFLAVVFLLLAPSLATAQNMNGSISGTVTDPSGGVVPGAEGAHEPDQPQKISWTVRWRGSRSLALAYICSRGGSCCRVKFPSAPRDRVSVAAYPFREFIVGWRYGMGRVPAQCRCRNKWN